MTIPTVTREDVAYNRGVTSQRRAIAERLRTLLRSRNVSRVTIETPGEAQLRLQQIAEYADELDPPTELYQILAMLDGLSLDGGRTFIEVGRHVDNTDTFTINRVNDDERIAGWKIRAELG